MILFEIWPSILCFSAPKIRNEGNTILLPEGEDARLICSVKGKETSGNKAIVFWEKNNDTIQPASHNRMRIRPYRYLKIKRVTKEDSGFYTCVAENSCGRNAITWRLVIGSKLLWRSIPAKIQCCILHSTFRILSYICCLTSEFTLSSFNFPRATFKFLPCTFTFLYAMFKFKFSRLHVLPSFRIQWWAFANQGFAFNIWLYVFHLQVCIVYSTF